MVEMMTRGRVVLRWRVVGMLIGLFFGWSGISCVQAFEEGSGNIMAATEEDYEHHKDFYDMSCSPRVNKPEILIAPDSRKRLAREVGVSRAFSFNPDQIIHFDENGDGEVDWKDKQYLSGELGNGRGQIVGRDPPYEEKDRTRLYVLSKEWDCRLYKGLISVCEYYGSKMNIRSSPGANCSRQQ